MMKMRRIQTMHADKSRDLFRLIRPVRVPVILSLLKDECAPVKKPANAGMIAAYGILIGIGSMIPLWDADHSISLNVFFAESISQGVSIPFTFPPDRPDSVKKTITSRFLPFLYENIFYTATGEAWGEAKSKYSPLCAFIERNSSKSPTFVASESSAPPYLSA